VKNKLISVSLAVILLLSVFTVFHSSAATQSVFIFDSSAVAANHNWEGYYRAIESIPSDDTAHSSMRAEGTPYYIVDQTMKNDLAATGTMDSDYTEIGSTTRYDSLTTSTGKSLLQYLLDEFGEQMYILDGGKKRAYTLWNSTVAAELKITYTSDYYYYMAAADQSRYNVADYQAALDALNDFLVHAHYNYAFNTYNENRYDEQLARYNVLVAALDVIEPTAPDPTDPTVPDPTTPEPTTPTEPDPEPDPNPDYERSTFTFDASIGASGLSWDKYFAALCSIPTSADDTAHAAQKASGTPYSVVFEFMMANHGAALDDLVIPAVNKKFISYFLNEFGEQMYILDGGKKRAYDLWNRYMPASLAVTYTSANYTYVSTKDQNLLTVSSYAAALNALNDFLVNAHYNYAYNTFNDSRYDEQVERYKTLEKAIMNIVFVTDKYDVSSYKKAGTFPERPGVVFAGWFADSAKTVPYKETTGTAYAKFVDEDIFTVKAQVTAKNEPTDPRNLRFISTLDSVAYSEAGFKITFNGKTVTQPVHNAYREMTAKNGTIVYKPTDICSDAAFFTSYTVTNVPFSIGKIPFRVTAYYVTLDGTEVSGEERLIYIENSALTPITKDQYYIYNHISDKYKAAYDRFYEALANCEETVDFSSYRLTSDEFFNVVFTGVINDCPEFWWFKRSYSYSNSVQDGTVYIGNVNPNYFFTGEELEKQKQKVDASAAKLLEGITASMSEYEREVIIHDRFVNAVTYVFNDYDQTAYGSLGNGEAICAGYARGLQYLLYKAGIVSTYTTGETKDDSGNVIYHAWLLVRIDGEYYFCDPTWADQDSINAIFHEYMNITTEELLKSRTLETMPWTIPTCTSTKANYWHVEDKISNGFELEKAARCLKNDGYIELHIIGDIDEFWATFKANKEAVLKAAGYDPTLTVSGYTLGDEFYIIVNGASSARALSIRSVAQKYADTCE